jgi:hypothetical protein
MAGFGGELLFFIGLGYVVLGPKRMSAALHHIARAKREFDDVRRQMSAQLSTAVDTDTKEPET